MNAETLNKSLDVILNARSSITSIRELILGLAMRGKLTAQEATDEAAFIQLERCRVQREQQLVSQKIKRRRNERVCDESLDAIVPLGWTTAKLADLVTIWNGRAYSKNELLAAGTPVLRVGNLFTNNHWYYSDLVLEPEKYCDNGDLLFAWSASFGPFIWDGPKVIYHYHIWKLTLHSEADLDKRFLYWFLLNKTREIKRSGHGVSMLHMTKEKMERLHVQLPPLAEQKRIVAKVDELMALCDELEAQQREREERKGKLVQASLARFAAAPTPDNLQFLFHKSYDIPPADLRKMILTLAVQGKLVRFETAAKSTCVGDHFDFQNGYAFKSEWFRSSGVRLCRNANVGHGTLNWGDTARVDDLRAEEFARFSLNTGDIVVSLDRPLISTGVKVARIKEHDLPCLLLQRVAKAIPRHKQLDLDYFFLWLNSSHFIDAIDPGRSNGVPHISTRQIQQLKFSPPNLENQRRTVVKVNELLALVDELERQLEESRATGAKLLEAIVRELTGGK